jgi:hypothetical protein
VILAIDPGNEYSAAVVLNDAGVPIEHWRELNEEALRRVRAIASSFGEWHLAIEMAESFGAKVWSQVFTTVLWTGRIVEAWVYNGGHPYTLVTRREVKKHLTGAPQAKDGQIRNCLIDKFGGPHAIGKKKTPGPLYGIAADAWQALAVGVTWREVHAKRAA